MIKVLALSHAYVEPFTRIGLVDIVRYPEFDLTVVIPEYAKNGSPERYGKLCAEFPQVETVKTYCNLHQSVHAYGPGLLRLLNKKRPDIVFLNYEPWSTAALQTAFFCRLLGLKTSVIVYTCENLVRKYPLPFRWFESYTLKRASVVATLPEQEAGEILLRKGYRGEIMHIPLAVNTDVFKKSPVAEKRKEIAGESSFVIGYVGRLVAEKGIPLLIEAMRNLDGRFRLLIIGNGSQKQELIRLADRYEVGNRVVFIESIPNDQLPVYMNCMDAMVLPSLTTSNWKEQFGRVLIEAMACEVPVIGSSSGEIPVVIGDGGMVFREGDAADLKEKIVRLAERPDLREELGKKGRKRAVEKYDRRRVMERTVELYKRVAGK